MISSACGWSWPSPPPAAAGYLEGSAAASSSRRARSPSCVHRAVADHDGSAAAPSPQRRPASRAPGPARLASPSHTAASLQGRKVPPGHALAAGSGLSASGNGAATYATEIGAVRHGAEGRYVAWRVADLSAFPNGNAKYNGARQRGRPITDVHRDGGDRNPWQETVCSCCGEPVWHQPEHAVGRRVVCWPCAEEEE